MNGQQVCDLLISNTVHLLDAIVIDAVIDDSQFTKKPLWTLIIADENTRCKTINTETLTVFGLFFNDRFQGFQLALEQEGI